MYGKTAFVTRLFLFELISYRAGGRSILLSALYSGWRHDHEGLRVSSAATSNCTSRGRFKLYQPERSNMVA
jgi:hypothetical protein